MKSFYLIFVLQLIAVSTGSRQNDEDQKTLIMLEFEPSQPDERSKRSPSDDESLRYIRQSAQLPPEYLGFLQQLSAQREQQAGGAQPQQHLIQQLVVARDGSKPPAAARYVLSQDGRLLQENLGLSAFGQPPQQFQQGLAGFPQPQQPQPQPQPQPQQPGRQLLNPELAEFSRQQQRLQQEYHDAPLRAQIAGLTTRPQPRPQQPQPPQAGPASQSVQAFLPPSQAQDPRLRAALQSGDPSLIYASLPADTQAYLQQQVAQQLAAQASVGVDGRQLFAQAQRQQQAQPQQILFQQPQPQPQSEAPQNIIYQQQPSFAGRRPISVAPSSQPQLLPQQYLIETSRQQPSASSQPQLDLSQIQYYQPQQFQQELQAQPQPQPQPQLRPQAQQQQQAQPDFSSLLQPSAGRGLFTPVKQPSRSSIYVSRQTSTPRPFGLSIEEVVNTASTNQKLPVVRLPPPSGQRPLTRNELDALINAGFSVTPVPNSESESSNYLKSKRQQPIIHQERKNHVVYQNHQDGVQYQYSPGSSTPFRPKKSATDLKTGTKSAYKSADIDRSDDRQVVTYVLALDNNSNNNNESS